MKKQPKKFWTTKEHKEFLALKEQKFTNLQIAAKMGRTFSSIESRSRILNAPSKVVRTDLWTADRIERLKKLWEDGLVARQIAAALGTTKSAVIGKAHRLKLTSRDKNYTTISGRAKPSPKPTPPKVIISEPVMENAVSFMELSRDNCRWPVGEPKNIKFCPEKNDGKHVYCAYHSSKAFTPTLSKLK